MFTQRLLTTLIALPLVLLFLFYASLENIKVLVYLLTLICAYEWGQLIPIKKNVIGVYLLSFLAILLLSHHYFYLQYKMGLGIWMGLFVIILNYPKFNFIWDNKWIVALFGFILLSLFANSLLEIVGRSQGKAKVVYLLFIVWAADVGAYIGGKRFGRHKLLPLVSPGKTIEGLISGIILSLIISICGALYFSTYSLIALLIGGLLINLISVFGDLFISMLKRRVNIKDTGHLIPGHGGLLDRLDSLIAASPFYLLMSTFMLNN